MDRYASYEPSPECLWWNQYQSDTEKYKYLNYQANANERRPVSMTDTTTIVEAFRALRAWQLASMSRILKACFSIPDSTGFLINILQLYNNRDHTTRGRSTLMYQYCLFSDIHNWKSMVSVQVVVETRAPNLRNVRGVCAEGKVVWRLVGWQQSHGC